MFLALPGCDALGDVYYDRGELDRAASEYTKSLELYRRLRDRGGESGALVALGWAAYDSGRRSMRNATTDRLWTLREAWKIGLLKVSLYLN